MAIDSSANSATDRRGVIATFSRIKWPAIIHPATHGPDDKSYYKRTVSFPLHSTSLPLKKASPHLTMEVSSNMGTLNRKELDHLERRELQLTVLAAAFVLIQAAGLAMFMYPLVFLHPIGNKWTLRAAFFGFCALTLLFVGYLLERQRTVRQLKQQILAELERNVTLQHQASVDLLQTMPDQNHFWDRLTMEYRRAMTMQRTLSILLVKAKPVGSSAKEQDGTSEAWSDAAKAMSRKLRPTDSIYRLATDTFALVLPETDVLNAKRVAIRLQEELQTVRAKHGVSFDITAHNYPEHVKSAHELDRKSVV